MKKWNPISLAELSEGIQVAITKMTKPEKRLWDLISITPSKWIQHPWGDEGGGFWVVAIWGNNCLYYNDIEEGYNTSGFKEYGTIEEYWCNQDELQWVILRILNEINAEQDN